MKTDNYLTLCLEQAAKSPLHYRHGCIIVRGGKVVGQGYNDYRPGFNGGSLKHGRIATAITDGPALAELKEKLRKQKPKPKEQQVQQQADTTKTFIPFEGTGGGHQANVPLSMHSEMMAIHSALAASSTMASTSFSCEKPCFKLPRSDKRKARLRREALAAYVQAVCATSQRPGLPQILHHHDNNDSNKRKEDQECLDDEEQEELLARRLEDTSLAFHQPLGGEKHHQKKKKEKKKRKNQKEEYQYQYDRYGQQTQHGRQQQSASEQSPKKVIRGYDLTPSCETSEFTTALPTKVLHGKHAKDYKRSGKMRCAGSTEAPQPEPLLLPKAHGGESSRNLADRKKHPRLNGADMYVARLGWCRGPAISVPKLHALISTSEDEPVALVATTDDQLSSSTSSFPSVSSTNNTRSSSLHDELTNPIPSPSPVDTCALESVLDTSGVRASRPCYRCISYMHSVGIKRVFWTNDEGSWEGGKVRDLVDALDSSMEDVASGGKGGPMGNGVFVTKHEVLMLKRMMG